MAFFITLATCDPDNMWTLRGKTRIRLTGPQGPLATHITQLPERSNGEWNLDAAQIAASLQVSSTTDQEIPLLLWDSGEPGSCPMRVIRFCGVSKEFDTELLVQTEILEPAGELFRGTGRRTNEALRLLGGRVTPKARWVWAAPRMAIGSTVVGPRDAA
jgi:hypothetical protein